MYVVNLWYVDLFWYVFVYCGWLGLKNYLSCVIKICWVKFSVYILMLMVKFINWIYVRMFNNEVKCYRVYKSMLLFLYGYFKFVFSLINLFWFEILLLFCLVLFYNLFFLFYINEYFRKINVLKNIIFCI